MYEPTHPATSGLLPFTVKGDVSVGCAAHAKLDMVAKPLRAGRILRGLPSDSARALTLLMAEDSSAVEAGAISTSAAHVTCSCRALGTATEKSWLEMVHTQRVPTRALRILLTVYAYEND